jgi:PAS domain S-box-containing protein
MDSKGICGDGEEKEVFAFFRDLKLNIKISLVGIVAVVATASALLALAAWQSGQYHRLAETEVNKLIDADLDHITQGVYNLVRTEDEAVQDQVNNNLRVAWHILERAGETYFSSETLTWTAVNQFTSESQTIHLPKLYVGDLWMKPNSDPAFMTPIVDDVGDLVGDTCTIFQRMDEKGDMLRVATSVKNRKGQRAIGTYIPSRNPDGTLNPVLEAVLQGKTFQGRAYVVNEWYLTAYQPIRDRSGAIIGMLYTGTKQKSLEARVRQAILQTQVGKTGYVYVIAGKGEQKGRYIISRNGERDGENIWDEKDSNGRCFIQSIVNKAVLLDPGEIATERYPWQNPGETQPRWKVARLAYYAPWDWVIGTSAYEDELEIYRAVLSEGKTRMVHTMGIVGVLIALAVGLLGLLIAWTVVRPIRRMTGAVETIMRGDLDHRVEIESHDEIGAWAEAFNQMTARLRETMAAIRKTNEHFESVLRASRAYSIISVDPDGIIQVFNQGAVLMLGYEPDEVIGKMTPLAFHDPDEVARRASELGIRPGFNVFVLNIHESEQKTREWTYIRKDGVRLTVLLTVTAMRSETGVLNGFIGIARDVTNEKKLEQQLLQSQKMETVGLLAGGIAHDFNNLLTPILGYTDLLLSNSPGGPQTELRQIRQAAERAKELISRLLTFSRKQVIELKTVDLGQIIRHFEAILRRTIREDIHINIQVSSSLCPIRADAGQIEQILINLSVNAQDAMPAGGILKIEAREVEVGESVFQFHPEMKPGRYHLLMVSDTGIGMDEKTLAHVFEPFFTTKEQGKGTGLGLSTVYGIVKQHNGFIYVYSEKNRGCAFEIYLPHDFEEMEKAEAVRIVPTEMKRGVETILVVEDDEMVRSFTSKILQALGYQVVLTGTVQEAIERVKDPGQTIDLLLSDVIMPTKNGMDLYEELRTLRPDLKAMFMSGYPRDVIGRHGILSEHVYFIQKPFSQQALAAKLREALDS